MNDEQRGRAWLTDRLGCERQVLDRLSGFVSALADENRRQNLVAPASLAHVWWRHIVDSAQLLAVSRETQLADGPWWDLGSGAGFPGLVIAALSPERPIVLVEERRRRSAWLAEAAAGLGLSNVQVRSQALERIGAEPAAVLSARAFAPLPKLLALAGRFSTPETLWLLPKGASARQEVDELPPRLRRMFHVEPSATDPVAGIIVGRGVAEARGA